MHSHCPRPVKLGRALAMMTNAKKAAWTCPANMESFCEKVQIDRRRTNCSSTNVQKGLSATAFGLSRRVVNIFHRRPATVVVARHRVNAGGRCVPHTMCSPVLMKICAWSVREGEGKCTPASGTRSTKKSDGLLRSIDKTI